MPELKGAWKMVGTTSPRHNTFGVGVRGGGGRKRLSPPGIFPEGSASKERGDSGIKLQSFDGGDTVPESDTKTQANRRRQAIKPKAAEPKSIEVVPPSGTDSTAVSTMMPVLPPPAKKLVLGSSGPT